MNYGTYLPYQGYQNQQPPQQSQFIVRPVASADEARAMQTDFSGAPVIMPDFAHGAIYVKQLNYQTGASDFRLFQQAQDRPVEYVEKSEFDELARKFNELIDKLGGQHE